MSDVLKEVPEFFEAQLGDSLILRTESLGHFRELGPPDLCHITKTQNKPEPPKIGSYHHVFGVDASSMASLAAYINTLTYAQEEKEGWFGKSPSAWRITSGVYCCYNAFSRVDMRVEVTIPGTVESYIVDARGDRHESNQELWQETFLSSIVRSLLYSDDHTYGINAGFRKFDPIPDPEFENKVLEVAEALFWKGPQLGADPEIQIATPVRNHLVSALMKHFSQSWRYDVAASFFERLVKDDVEVAALLAEAYLGMDEEIKAVRILHEAIRSYYSSYALIHVQVEFLRTKGKYEMAKELAKHAVHLAPSEFVTWAKLADVYIDLEDFENALLTLNSCPMFTFNERDLPKTPAPLRTHYLWKPEPLGVETQEELDVYETVGSLPRLPGSMLKGTFSRAYAVLAKLTKAIGWDELLKHRSTVFVMEEEYRQIKAKEEESFRSSKHQKRISSSVVSTSAVETTSATLSSSSSTMKPHDEMEDVSLNAPTSEESSTPVPASTDQNTENDNQKVPASTSPPEQLSLISRPKEVAPKSQTDSDTEAEKKPQVTPFNAAFNKKRLCERWLDNLFMVLYEDLRAYTIWRADLAHHRKQDIAYFRSPADWEALGDLAFRLFHIEESRDAYIKVVESGKFSAHAVTILLKMYAQEDNIPKAMEMIVRLARNHDRHFNDCIYPIEVTHRLNQFIRAHGISKVNNTLISDPAVSVASQKLVQRYMQYVKVFGLDGWDI